MKRILIIGVFVAAFIILIVSRFRALSGKPLGAGRYEAITWSPDGSQLAFTFSTTDYPELWLFNVDTEEYLSIALEVAGEILPYRGLSWQNNDTLWFISRLQNEYILNRANIANRHVDAVMNIVPWGWDGLSFRPYAADELIFSQSPQYSTVSQVSRQELYLLNVKSLEMSRLTYTSDIREIDPKWSPQGELIAFNTGNLMIKDLDKSSSLTVDVNVSYGVNRFSWSPDGMWLLYIGANIRSLHLIEADGGSTTSRTIISDPVFEIAWSPEGSYLAYTNIGTPKTGNELHLLPASELGLSLPITVD